MSFNQTRDLLDFARQFHRNLAHFYEGLLERAPSGKTPELIHTLIEHELVMEKRLREYEEEESANILDTFFKYVVDKHEDCFSSYPLPENITPTLVIAATRHFDECLSNFYREMARKAMSENVREMLFNLMEMELREQMLLSKHSLELAST